MDELRGLDSLVHCTLKCCDLPYQYIGDYHEALVHSLFHPIRNKVSPTITLRMSYEFLFCSEPCRRRILSIRRIIGTWDRAIMSSI